MALCGACTVYIDGQPTRSCTTALSSIKQSAEVTTIEGLKTKEAQAVQAAWEKLDVPQCGYCQSGQVMSAAALLAKNKRPTDADIDAAMTGNICRCATYVRIRAAIKEAAKSLA
jgi:isoquinoline 1-oxidoreductase alpha subunit